VGPDRPITMVTVGPLRPMPVGTPTRVRFDLLRTSVVRQAGHRLRIAIAGHDEGHFAPVPANTTPTYTVHHDRTYVSALTLPVGINPGDEVPASPRR
jgi:uncharacterized protein